MGRIVTTGAACGIALLAAACGDNRFDRTVTGAALGAVSGAGAGVLLGPLGVASGALIGGGAGAGVGFATSEDQVNLGRPVYRWASGWRLPRSPPLGTRRARRTTRSFIVTTAQARRDAVEMTCGRLWGVAKANAWDQPDQRAGCRVRREGEEVDQTHIL